jgi:alpha-galactosidase
MDLEVNEDQFPLGMKRLAEDIRALGFKPGIWIPPWGTGSDDFYEAHREWFLHDENRKPIACWNGKYTLDPTVVEAREHLKNMFRIASREWGYEFFKIDGISGRRHELVAHFYERPEIRSRFRDPSCPNPFELCIKAFREGIGDDRIFLACQGHATGPESLYADAARLGADIVYPNEPVRWENVLNQGRCFLNQAYTHGIVMIADPDTLLVKDLNTDEARVSAALIALPGQFTFFGDKLSGLSQDQMNILRQTLPAINVHPEQLYPFFSMLPIWNLRISHKALGNYNTVAFFNWEDENRTIFAEADELGLDKDAVYAAYEFWTGKTFLWKTGNFSLEVPPRSVRIIAIHKELAFPQWIGSDRHISLSGMEVSSWNWDNKAGKLTGMVRCVGGFSVKTAVRVPGSFRFAGIECKAAQGTVQEEDGVLKMNILSNETRDVPFTLVFGKL